MNRIVDLSIALADEPMVPAHHRPSIAYTGHHDSWKEFNRYYPDVTREDMLDGEAWATEKLTLLSHSGTHMDAPWHYHSTTNHRSTPGGERAWTIDEIPLDWLLRPGVKLDFSTVAPGHVVSRVEMQAAVARAGHVLQPLDIVLVNTAAGRRHGQDDYWEVGCGIGAEATIWLAEQGVKVVGTDAFSWDAPFHHTASRYRETGDARLIWEGHKAGREMAYCQMEKLTNLEDLPSTGFTVACFPIKIKAASAGWVRAVAIL